MAAVRGLRSAEVLYVLAVACLAAVGAARGTPAPYVAAILLTLPCGLPATVAVYGGYAALKGVGSLFAAATYPNGDDAPWLTAASSTLNVTVLTAAAVANVLLLERARRKHARAAGR